MQKLYSTKEVAEVLGVTQGAVRQWRLIGKLKPTKIGSLCRYSEEEIDRFLKSMNGPNSD
jgi:excisionase family DNA binding protein